MRTIGHCTDLSFEEQIIRANQEEQVFDKTDNDDTGSILDPSLELNLRFRLWVVCSFARSQTISIESKHDA